MEKLLMMPPPHPWKDSSVYAKYSSSIRLGCQAQGKTVETVSTQEENILAEWEKIT